MLQLVPGLVRVWWRPCEISLMGGQNGRVPGMEVGTSHKGLLPQETQMPRRAGTAHGPAAPWVMAHPGSIHLPTHSLLTCQPTAFPVTQTLMAKESVKPGALLWGSQKTRPAGCFHRSVSALWRQMWVLPPGQPPQGAWPRSPGHLLHSLLLKQPKDETGKTYFVPP